MRVLPDRRPALASGSGTIAHRSAVADAPGSLPPLRRYWTRVLLAQAIGYAVLLVVLLLPLSIGGLAPGNVSGGVIYAPWPVVGVGSGLAALGWGTIVSLTIGLLLWSDLSGALPRPPSLASLAVAVAVGGYVPFALVGGLARGDLGGSAAVPALVLTSLLVRGAVRRAHRATGPPRRVARRRELAGVLVVAVVAILPWSLWHPLSADELSLTDAGGGNASMDDDATRTVAPGKSVRADVSVQTAARVRLLELRPETPDGLRAVVLRSDARLARTPATLRHEDGRNLAFRLIPVGCPSRPLRVSALRVRYQRLGRELTQRLPLPTVLTVRCEPGR